MNTDKEFFDLLNTLVEEQTYEIEFLRNNTEEKLAAKFKQLSTSQLKELIKTAVDSPITQAAFSSAATKIFKESIVGTNPSLNFNLVDRLLFLLETRVQILSPVRSITHENKQIEINYKTLLEQLKNEVAKNIEVFDTKTSTDNKITITYGVALIDVDVQIEEEMHKEATVNIESIDELRKIVGEAFLNEVAKSIHSITIEDKTLTFSNMPFKKRIKIVETLPASLMQKVIEYIECYKNVINTCLTIDGYTVPIDSTLFSVK